MYVEMKHIEKNYGSFHASRDVSFGIDKGKLVALLGPSGSGKTTILRMLAGLENPNSGDIFIDGRRVNDIPAAKRGIGFVFQNYALFRYMTVFDNVAFGLEIQFIHARNGFMRRNREQPVAALHFVAFSCLEEIVIKTACKFHWLCIKTFQVYL